MEEPTNNIGAENDRKPKGNAAKSPPIQEAAVYDINALTDGSAAWTYFDYPPELVAVALNLAVDEKNNELFTVAAAKDIVKKFAARKVK